MVEQAIAGGARGITIGRRVWQRPIDEATELLRRLAAIVHAEWRGPVRSASGPKNVTLDGPDLPSATKTTTDAAFVALEPVAVVE